MTPKLYGHPFSSYTQKAFVAFYEKQEPFEFALLEPHEAGNVARHRQLWPIGRFPVVECDGVTLLEASVIVEWVDARSDRGPRLIPEDPVAALHVRMLDRIFDCYVMDPMQKIVLDRLRPEGLCDAFGVADARERLDRIYDWLDRELAGREWAAGDAFTLADCAAAPSLFYADWVQPFDGRDNLIGYAGRLRARSSFAKCVEDARSMRAYFPGGAPKDRFE